MRYTGYLPSLPLIWYVIVKCSPAKFDDVCLFVPTILFYLSALHAYCLGIAKRSSVYSMVYVPGPYRPRK